jgi:hypothetical protein
LTRRQLELGHPAAGQAEMDSNVRAVWRDNGSFERTAPRLERWH